MGRDAVYQSYNHYLGYYQVQFCLEHARGGSLLDMPCGDGALTEMFAPHFDRVVGVDASAKHLSEAKKRLPGVTFHKGLIEDIVLDETFDMVAMLNVLEHVQNPVLVRRKQPVY